MTQQFNMSCIKSSEYRIYQQVLITPSLAGELLKTSIGNRNLRPRAVIAYAESIRRGEWEATGQAIMVDVDGALRNGHHRLRAIVEAGIAQSLDIAVGCSRKAVQVADGGCSRTAADGLKLGTDKAYRENAKQRVSCLNVCLELSVGTIIPIRTAAEFMRWLPPFKAGVDWAVRVFTQPMTRYAPVMGSLAFAHRTDPEMVEAFGTALASGEGLHRGEPAYTLRDYLANGRHKADNRLVVARKVLNCAAAHSKGERMSKVYDTRSGVTLFRATYLNNKALRELAKPWDVDLFKQITAENHAV